MHWDIGAWPWNCLGEICCCFMYHLIHEHFIGDTSPHIPGQLLVQIFITKGEERALGIQEQVTASWRRQNNIPDSDSFDTYLQGPQVDKRNRSDTVSTANSDRHDKRHKLVYTRVDSIFMIVV